MEDPIEGGAENVGCQNAASQIHGDYNGVLDRINVLYPSPYTILPN
jgi:hypothetical protein